MIQREDIPWMCALIESNGSLRGPRGGKKITVPQDFNSEHFIKATTVKIKETGCLRWKYKKCKNKNGVPVTQRGGQQTTLRRFLQTTISGPIPAGMVVSSSCHVPDCLNPDHFIVCDFDEIYKKVPAQWGNQKVTGPMAMKIREIYSSGEVTQKILAAQYGVPQNLISSIVLGKSHVAAGGPLAQRKRQARRLTANEAKQIRVEYALGEITIAQLAEKYERSYSSVVHILSGFTLPRAGGPLKEKGKRR